VDFESAGGGAIPSYPNIMRFVANKARHPIKLPKDKKVKLVVLRKKARYTRKRVCKHYTFSIRWIFKHQAKTFQYIEQNSIIHNWYMNPRTAKSFTFWQVAADMGLWQHDETDWLTFIRRFEYRKIKRLIRRWKKKVSSNVPKGISVQWLRLFKEMKRSSLVSFREYVKKKRFKPFYNPNNALELSRTRILLISDFIIFNYYELQKCVLEDDGIKLKELLPFFKEVKLDVSYAQWVQIVQDYKRRVKLVYIRKIKFDRRGLMTGKAVEESALFNEKNIMPDVAAITTDLNIYTKFYFLWKASWANLFTVVLPNKAVVPLWMKDIEHTWAWLRERGRKHIFRNFVVIQEFSILYLYNITGHYWNYFEGCVKRIKNSSKLKRFLLAYCNILELINDTKEEPKYSQQALQNRLLLVEKFNSLTGEGEDEDLKRFTAHVEERSIRVVENDMDFFTRTKKDLFKLRILLRRLLFWLYGQKDIRQTFKTISSYNFNHKETNYLVYRSNYKLFLKSNLDAPLFFTCSCDIMAYYN
jgi:hypothetical protein